MLHLTFPASPAGITRKQAIIVAVLVAILMAVLMVNLSSEKSRLLDAMKSVEVAGTEKTSSGADSDDRKDEHKMTWPQISLERTLVHNPFAAISDPPVSPVEKPATAADSRTTGETQSDTEAAIASRDRDYKEAIVALQRQRVKLTLRAGNKATALIGEKLVSEGEVVDGVRILSILPNGILVEPSCIQTP